MLKNSALIIIDMQNDFVLPGSPACVAGALATIPNITRVLEKFRKERASVFYIVREYRKDGSDIEISRQKSFLHGSAYVEIGRAHV